MSHHLAILDELPVGVWVARAPSGEVVYVNRAFRVILGMEAREGVPIEGAPATYGIHDRTGALYPVEGLPFTRALVEGGPVQVDDLVIHRSDGRRVDVRAFATPMRGADGQVSQVIVVFTDITEEVRAIEQRERAEQRYRFTVSHAPLILWATDAEGRFTLSEGAGLAVLGLKPGESVGRSVFDMYGAHPQIPTHIRRALHHGEPSVHTIEVQGRTFESRIEPLRDEAGAVTGLIGLATDVTELRQLLANAALDDRVRALGMLAASVAHEINNPLTYILGNLDQAELELARAREVLGPDHPAREALDKVADRIAPALTGAERVRLITRDLRTFSRPHESRTRVDVGEVLLAALHLVRKDIEARARLEVELAPMAAVLANEAQLVQVFLNLLVNAWQAFPQVDLTRQVVWVRGWTEGEHVVVEVADNGPGLAPEVAARVFEPFVTTKEVGEGTGLGLFVSRNIVRHLGGTLTAHERQGGGARFRVEIPAAAEPAPEPASGSPAPAAGRPRVLIVDDDPLVRDAFCRALRGEFEVESASDGAEALQLLEERPPYALVYCDLVMSRTSGTELREILLRRRPEVVDRVVFMTGGAFTAEAAALVAELPDAVLQKPFDMLADARRRLAGG